MSNIKECSSCHRLRAIAPSRTKCEGCRAHEAAINNGTLKGPSYSKVNTIGYKDPMQKVDNGFGYYGALTQTNDGEFVQCHICGYYFASLGAHVRTNHGINPRDYKLTYGLRITEGMLSPVQLKKAQDNYNKYAHKTRAEFAAMSKMAGISIKAKGYQAGGNQWTAQSRNEKGNCKEQTLAKIKSLGERMGGYPTMSRFLIEYGKGQQSVVNYWFGSWDNALKIAGFKTYREKQEADRQNYALQTLGKIRDFFDQHGRTPLFSDFRGSSDMPDPTTIMRNYGTLNEARKQAGVPQLIHKGLGRWEEAL